MHVEILGETYVTLGRRLLLLDLLLLLLLLLSVEVVKIKTGPAGNIKSVNIFNAEKIQRRKFSVVESAQHLVVSYGNFINSTISLCTPTFASRSSVSVYERVQVLSSRQPW